MRGDETTWLPCSAGRTPRRVGSVRWWALGSALLDVRLADGVPFPYTPPLRRPLHKFARFFIAVLAIKALEKGARGRECVRVLRRAHRGLSAHRAPPRLDSRLVPARSIFVPTGVLRSQLPAAAAAAAVNTARGSR